MSAPSKSLIVSDVGGTHARFAVAVGSARTLCDVREFNTADFATFEAALGTYIGGLAEERPDAIAVGAAGPLVQSGLKLTNAPWHLDPKAIASALDFREVILANDLVAYAAGIAQASPGDLIEISPAKGEAREVVVVALGTGLGAARFERRDGVSEVFPTEAGHMTYAPETDEEAQLSALLKGTHPRLSFEHVVSGSGLPHVYAALSGKPAPVDGAAVVALAVSDPAADRTLRLATASVATFARDLVLAGGGADALVIGGGLGRALERLWREPLFLDRLRKAPAMPIDLGGLGVYLVEARGLPLLGIADLAWGRAVCKRLLRHRRP